MNDVERVAEALGASDQPLSIPQLVSATGIAAESVDRVLWSHIDRFVWQPGHTWSLNTDKTGPIQADPVGADTRRNPLMPVASNELRAVVLSNGIQLRVGKRPIDSDAAFTIRSVGNSIELTFNTAHEVFADLPIPFDDEAQSSDYRRLVEVLLASWAIYEDRLPGDQAKRAASDARHAWGRQSSEILGDL